MALFSDNADTADSSLSPSSDLIGFNPLNKYIGVSATAGDALSLPEEVIYGSMATVVDVGTTYWNSLMPQKYEVTTQDLLSRINTDALQVYNEHPDAVRTASFIAGTLLPVGLSMKGMGLLRSGAKGASWFSEAGQASNLAKVEQAFSEAGPINSAFNTVKWNMYRNVALNNVLDSTVAEIAILGTMSAHPYMEDYTKDLGKNFLLSVATGGVLGSAFGTIIAKGAITKAVAPIENEANKILFNTLRKSQVDAGISEISHVGEQVAVKSNAIENLKNLVAEAKDPLSDITLAPYTIARLENTIEIEGAKLFDNIAAVSKGDLKTFIENAPEASKQYIVDFVSKAENVGLDKMSFAKVEASKLAEQGSGILSSTANFIKQTINKEGEKVTQNVDAYYSSVFDSYFAKADSVNYLTMADLGTSIKALEKEANPKNFIFHRPEASIEREVEHSARVDADFAKTMLATKDMSVEELKNLVIHPEDLSMLRAVYLRATELGASDIAIQIRRDKASWTAINQQILKRTGLNPNYGNDLRAMEKEWDQYSLYNHGQKTVGAISEKAENVLNDWVRGNARNLRYAASAMRNILDSEDSLITTAGKIIIETYKPLLQEIQASKPSQALRARLAKIADADGNVWLYRGMHGEPTGHQAIESYTIIPEKAAEFGKSYEKGVKLYKVHVDDIIGTVKDFGPSGKRPEILAFPPTRDFYDISKNDFNKIPDEILLKGADIVSEVKPNAETIKSLDALQSVMRDEILRSVQTLSKAGYGIEAISIRTGTPVDVISEILSSGYVPAGGLFKYTSVQDIEQALQTEKRSLALTTIPGKNISIDIKTNLDKLNLDQTSAGLAEMYLLTSQSQFVQDFGKRFMTADFKALTQELLRLMPDFEGASMKSSLFASANQVLSANPALATVATVMGKEAIALRNEMKEAFEKPLANMMAAVIKDDAVRIEAATALNLNASLSGFRAYKDGQFWTKAIVDGKETLIPAQFRGKDFTIVSPAVKDLMETIQNYGREMYEIGNVHAKAIGRQSISDIGFWVPSVNFANKEIAYAHDLGLDKVTMLYADTVEDLNNGIAAYKKAMAVDGKTVDIVTKDKATIDAFNTMTGRHDPMYMEVADLTQRHGGSSASTFVSTDASVFQEILSGYNNHVERKIDDLIKLQLAPVMDHLKNLSDISQTGYNASKAGVVTKLINKPTDTGQVLANILMGKSNLSQHPIWAEWQQRGQAVTDSLLNRVSEAFSPILSGGKRTPEMWEEIQKRMDSSGMFNAYAGTEKMLGLDRYLAEGRRGQEALTPRTISLFNGLAATSLLKFMELGQPLVNALSLPILTSGAIRRKMASNFFGTELDSNAKFAIHQVMTDGIRLMMHPTEGLKWSQLGEAKNLFTPELRNITELMEQARSLQPGVIHTLEDAMESKFVNFFSGASNYSEEMVRKVSYFNGIVLAKQAYPGLSDTGILTFARGFMDEAIGNYTSQQRPALFQGTFGTGFGLFQTYMLTLAQQIYRGVEHRDWVAIGKQMLTQATIFGGASLPGFHLVSQAIGENFSDNHIDLETGLFRAVSNPVANMMLYGLPSSLGPGVTTRGDIQPQLPNPFQGINSVAAANILGQAYTAAERVIKAAGSADENAGRAMLEALSLQSVSRPVARFSELLTGKSLTGAGNAVMDVPQPLFSIDNILTQSTISRILATRPTQEVKAREAMQLNSVYGQADAARQKAVSQRLKSHIRSGRMDSETLDTLSYEYMRTGTPTGWRSAVNEALIQEAGPASNTVKRKLAPDSPLQMMIEDQD